jgi:hypothetical protein
LRPELKKGKGMDLILARTCNIARGMVPFLFFLVLGTLRLVRELREDLGNVRFRLKQLDGRILWRRGQDGHPPGQKAPAFQLPRFVGARTPPRHEQEKLQSRARCGDYLGIGAGVEMSLPMGAAATAPGAFKIVAGILVGMAFPRRPAG